MLRAIPLTIPNHPVNLPRAKLRPIGLAEMRPTGRGERRGAATVQTTQTVQVVIASAEMRENRRGCTTYSMRKVTSYANSLNLDSYSQKRYYP